MPLGGAAAKPAADAAAKLPTGAAIPAAGASMPPTGAASGHTAGAGLSARGRGWSITGQGLLRRRAHEPAAVPAAAPEFPLSPQFSSRNC